jgi:hypothetical protein
VLHRFEGACNLVSDQDEVISLVSSEIGPGPFSLMVEGDLPAELDVRSTISINDRSQTLNVGSLSVSYGEATVWNPVPDWSRIQQADRMTWPPPATLSVELDGYLTRTIRGIAANRPAECLTGVEGLAGRGSGLTPSGDDVLMGVLFGLWVWRQKRDWMELIMKAAVQQTTTLSANFIRAAVDGEAVWQWHALAAGQNDAIAQIHRIGHMSGAEAWAGFARTDSTLSQT